MNKMSKEEFKQSVANMHYNLTSDRFDDIIQHTKELIEQFKDHDAVLARFMQNDLDNIESVKAYLKNKLEIVK